MISLDNSFVDEWALSAEVNPVVRFFIVFHRLLDYCNIFQLFFCFLVSFLLFHHLLFLRLLCSEQVRQDTFELFVLVLIPAGIRIAPIVALDAYLLKSLVFELELLFGFCHPDLSLLRQPHLLIFTESLEDNLTHFTVVLGQVFHNFVVIFLVSVE